PILLAKSREAQVEVSTRLSRQVLAALHELMRGFVTADVRQGGTVTELARCNPDHLYGGLITALMRLVFVLYAEDRGLMPDHPVYQQYYSLGGLFARLRSDVSAWPDTMDQRFGAWAQLLSLFRLIHRGGGHAGFRFVARQGALFDPDRFPFLEGRGLVGKGAVPMVPDATVWKVLQSLMMLDGERLSYRTLDVEQIGSVYESIMGFRVELTTGRSIAVTSSKRSGAAVVIDLDGLLELEGGKRAKALQDATNRRLTGKAAAKLRSALIPADVVAALDSAVDRDVTPDILPEGTPVLQPTDERRRSGSHYTPRSLTEPIVSEALRPLLDRLGPDARPGDILDLKVLDPATGSGAFLVEACRQLSSRLVEAWSIHGGPTDLPSDEDELLHAQRLVAQRCLYGVDKNPMAIDLARLSLWLATLAKDHEFTFIDHALRHGDSLVGLTCRQIEGFHWDADAPRFQMGLESMQVRSRVARALELRQLIRELGEEMPEQELRELLEQTENELRGVCWIADLVLAAFFESRKPKERERRRLEYRDLFLENDGRVNASLASTDPQIAPFHWELEFPEVFERESPGFDAVIGNPPFAGKNTVIAANAASYPDWLKKVHAGSHGNADLVAHFFRRAFGLLREGGALGLIATNTIAQDDTRSTGLRWICKNGGEIYRADRRIQWPGEAAVVVSVVHISKGSCIGRKALDNREVGSISAFLSQGGGHDDPARLTANEHKSFQGSIVLGMGFTFDDTDNKGVATPLAEMHRLIEENPRNQVVIFPYIGGDEVNSSPTHAHHRYVINFWNYPLRRESMDERWREADEDQRREWLREGIVPLDYPEPVAADWPDLLEIVGTKVKTERLNKKDSGAKEKWWQFIRPRPELHSTIAGLDRVLFHAYICQHLQFTFLPKGMVYAGQNVFALSTHAAFCSLQSRPHEIWARFFSSTLEDCLNYSLSDCFETYPFPESWERHPTLEEAGAAYFDYRASLMVENDEGMTKTYNRFHDPGERDPRITRLRELHAAMDRAVLDAYGWCDISTECEFLLDFEIDPETWGNRKKPWRYRWRDEVCDEVLARLLALNAERAAEERMAEGDAGSTPRRVNAAS
ncbi:MAG: N-6 DNA methylase, partial [Bryobacterales bacterium]|nr:N-6 DNA methylase [Bryobacterales bacterium]